MDKKDYLKFLGKPKISYIKFFSAKPTDTNQANYKKYLNKFHKIKTHNLKSTWSLINEIINKRKTKSTLPKTFKENDKMIADPK